LLLSNLKESFHYSGLNQTSHKTYEIPQKHMGNKHLWWYHITEAKKDWKPYTWLFEVLMWKENHSLFTS